MSCLVFGIWAIRCNYQGLRIGSAGPTHCKKARENIVYMPNTRLVEGKRTSRCQRRNTIDIICLTSSRHCYIDRHSDFNHPSICPSLSKKFLWERILSLEHLISCRSRPITGLTLSGAHSHNGPLAAVSEVRVSALTPPSPRNHRSERADGGTADGDGAGGG